ncbi:MULTISPECIES: DUF6113 family protein [unclassified Microbacterium]|uniref:DUF6113 family protein n=1 Tax=unclassified Microbacterium TaxID=2609290 RepID=UPI00300FCCB8
MGSFWSRIGAWVVAFVIGAFYGVAGTVAQGFRLGWFPLGLVLALVGVTALLVAVRLLTSDRWATLATALGAMVATLVFSGAGPGGSVVVPQEADGAFNPGVAWTILVPLVSAIVIAWPQTRVPAVAASDRTA